MSIIPRTNNVHNLKVDWYLNELTQDIVAVHEAIPRSVAVYLREAGHEVKNKDVMDGCRVTTMYDSSSITSGDEITKLPNRYAKRTLGKKVVLEVKKLILEALNSNDLVVDWYVDIERDKYIAVSKCGKDQNIVATVFNDEDSPEEYLVEEVTDEDLVWIISDTTAIELNLVRDMVGEEVVDTVLSLIRKEEEESQFVSQTSNETSNKEVKKEEEEIVSLQMTSCFVFGEDKPTVYIDPTTKSLSQQIVDLCKYEIAWYLTLTKREDGSYLIGGEPIIPPQEVTGTSVNISPEGAGALLEEIDDKGASPIDYRVHCHSHVNMGVSPSPTDDDHFGTFLENFAGMDCARMIINKKGDIHLDLLIGDRKLVFTVPVKEENREDVTNEINKKVKVVQTENTFSSGYRGNYTGYSGGYTGYANSQGRHK